MQQTFSTVQRFKKNTTGRDFVVGDLHGCFSQLRKELAMRQYDPARDRLFAVGDLVDRGFESPAVLDVVREYRIHSVRGNHEDAIVRWHRYGSNAAALRGNGAEWLLDMAKDDAGPVHDIVDYMAALPFAIEIETDHGLVGIVHADVPLPSWPQTIRALDQEHRDGPLRHKTLWDRSRWKARRSGALASMRRVATQLFPRVASAWREPDDYIDGISAVIVGHTPTREPKVRGNVINVDTGVVFGGTLTLLCVDQIPQLLNRATRQAHGMQRSRRYPAGSGV